MDYNETREIIWERFEYYITWVAAIMPEAGKVLGPELLDALSQRERTKTTSAVVGWTLLPGPWGNRSTNSGFFT